MFDKSWQKYGVYHFDLHELTILFLKKNLFQINHYFIRYTLVSKLLAYNLNAYIWGPYIMF